MIVVSGIDEQKIICPICKKEPDYWICNFEIGQCWLLSNRYLALKPIYSRHVVYESRLKERMPELDRIKTIRCSCSQKMHIPESNIYVKVLRKMKEFREREGINFNSGGTAQ